MNTMTQPTTPRTAAPQAPRWVCLGTVCGRCNVVHRSYRTADAHCQAGNRSVSSDPGGNSYSDQWPQPLNEAAERQLSAALHRVHRTGEDYLANFDFGALVDSM